MIKIIFLIRSLEVGGAERQLCVLAKGLYGKGYDVKVVVFYENGLLETELLDSGVPIIGLKRKSRWDLIPFYFRLVDLMRREAPDILHSYLPVANIWAVLVKIFLSHTRVVWGVRASNMDMKQYDLQVQLTNAIEILLSGIPDWIICNSQAGLHHAVKKGFPKGKMSVISNGIDTTRFFPDRECGRHLRKYWNIQDHEKLIGMVARIDSIKGHPNFLRASALLLQDIKNVRFVCVGDGAEDIVKDYKEVSRSLGLENVVIWADNQEDMLEVYNALDIFVSPSDAEGFSNVIGEAMACGLPCVVTDVGDSAWLVGDLGVVVPRANSEALKDGISSLLKRSAQQEIFFTNQLIQRVVELFSINALVSNTIGLFEMIIDAHIGTVPKGR